MRVPDRVANSDHTTTDITTDITTEVGAIIGWLRSSLQRPAKWPLPAGDQIHIKILVEYLANVTQ